MNIFKIGLLLSVLLFNLSCSTLPKSQSDCPLVSTEKQDENLEIDGNIAESSFINFESKNNTNISQLMDYLSEQGIHDEASTENLEQLLTEMHISSDQLKSIESEFAEYDTSPSEKALLQSLINKLQNEKH